MRGRVEGRRGALALAAMAVAAPIGAARAQGGNLAPGGAAAPPRRAVPGELWFDPTQLPSFTGTVERYLLNPRGETDALLFREGPQVVFPPDVAEAVRHAAAPGRPIIVWGIRARTAPVITMLAFAPNAETTPVLVERFYWRLSGRQPPHERMQGLSAAGTVKQPYWSPTGEVAGAVLEDGTVVLLPQGAVSATEGLRDLLKPGARLAAEGPGAVAQAAEGAPANGPPPPRALLAERIGEQPGALRQVSAAAEGSAPAPPQPQR